MRGATLVDGQATTGTWLRMGLNYVAPFVVASVGYLAAHRRPRPSGAPSAGRPDGDTESSNPSV